MRWEERKKEKKREEEAMKKPIFANRLEILFIIYILRCRMGRRISFKSWDESSLKKKKLVKTGLSLSKENFHVGIWVINFIIFLLILPGPNLVFFLSIQLSIIYCLTRRNIYRLFMMTRWRNFFSSFSGSFQHSSLNKSALRTFFHIFFRRESFSTYVQQSLFFITP